MLKYCVETMFENKGEGLLQACISSICNKTTHEETRRTQDNIFCVNFSVCES